MRGLKPALCIIVAACAVFYGATLCIDMFNRVVEPPQPVRLVQVRRLDPERLAVEVLGLRLLLAVPSPITSFYRPRLEITGIEHPYRAQRADEN